MRSLLFVLALLALVLIMCGTVSAEPLQVKFQILHAFRSLEDVGAGASIAVYRLQPPRAIWLDVGGLYQNRTESINFITGFSTETQLAEILSGGLANKAGISYVPARGELRLIFARDFGD